jgi:hypothetical protein
MNVLMRAVVQLLEETGSMRAAAKAGKKTGISVRVIRQNGSVEDYGQLGLQTISWRDSLKSLFGSKARQKIIYRVGSREIDSTEVDLL